MARPRKGEAPKGSIRFRNGKFYARVSLGKKRPTYLLDATDERTASARAQVLAELASQLVAGEALDVAAAILKKAARCADSELPTVRRLADAATSGRVVKPSARKGMTFKTLGQMWTGGDLAALHPDHVREKKSVDDDVQRLDQHIYPLVGDVPIAAFGIDHAERVMQSLPRSLKANTRRNIAVLIHRVLELAVFPVRVRDHNPLPRGWLPNAGSVKIRGFLYPAEDAQFLACPDVPFRRRFAYGMLAREGFRKSEGKEMLFDLENGTITLDRNKTGDARPWAMDPGVTAALRAAQDSLGSGEIDAIMTTMANLRGDELREDLRTAGVTRPELFIKSDEREPFTVHQGLRGTFVTLSLANGRSEAWVCDRTAHKSSAMLQRYNRGVRLVEELAMGALIPLVDALPELSGETVPPGPKTGPTGDADEQDVANGAEITTSDDEQDANFGFENRRSASYRGFESLLLRQRSSRRCRACA